VARKLWPESIDSFVAPPEDVSDNVRRFDDRRSWLEARHNVIGCSDVAKILGLHPKTGAWRVFQEKVCRLIDDGPPDPMAVAGHYDEPTLARWFWDQRPELLQKGLLQDSESLGDLGDFCQVRAKETPVPIACTPDRFLRTGYSLPPNDGSPLLSHDWAHRTAAVELKCAFKQQVKRWRRGVPIEHILQLQFTMLCLEVDRGFFVKRLDGFEFGYHPMRRDDEIILDASAETARAMAAMYDSQEAEVELDAKFEALDKKRQEHADTMATAEKEKGDIENQIRDALGKARATVGVIPGQAKWTWRPDKNGKRRLRRSKVGAS
jgi:predicted phage-related endonuclease